MTITISRQRMTETDAFCRARDNNPYAFGGAFTTDPRRSTDCSGLVLQTAGFIMGRKDWSGNRYGSTESFRLGYQIVYDLGFRRIVNGKVPVNTLMRVGLMHGGGGEYSHTACTLFHTDKPGGALLASAGGRGVDWESSGSYGVQYYDYARAWNDSLFHDFWYLDAVLAPVQQQVVLNEINECAKKYPSLGKRLTEGETRCPDGQGLFAQFENGYVYWSPNVRKDLKPGDRAVMIPNPVFKVWAQQGWERGPLGYPVAQAFNSGVAWIQAFQNGAVYGNFIVHGAILDAYRNAKFEQGWGMPLENEHLIGDGVRQQRFEKKIAYWHPSGVTRLDSPVTTKDV